MQALLLICSAVERTVLKKESRDPSGNLGQNQLNTAAPTLYPGARSDAGAKNSRANVNEPTPNNNIISQIENIVNTHFVQNNICHRFANSIYSCLSSPASSLYGIVNSINPRA